jgi:hypothetical protein
MKRTILTTVSIILFAFGLSAQEYAQASFGNNYSEQAFFRFSDLSADNIVNESWDIAFSVNGGFSIGVHLNEAVPASFGDPAPYLELYLAPVESFSDDIDLAAITDTLYNPEENWDMGAVNSTVDPDDPFDMGWGLYDPTDHSVNGNRVYVIKLRDNSYRKFEVTSLIGGAYTFTYANLDGSGESVIVVDGADYDSSLALFSFDTGEAVESPGNWDLLFSRYITTLDAGGGSFVNYTVAGVLIAPGVEVAVASGIPPSEATSENYVDAYETGMDVIGHEWKAFNLSAFEWVLDDSLAFYIKTVDEHLWKVIFIDFEGSSTGISTFEVEDLGTVAVDDLEDKVASFGVFPNPVEDHFVLSIELEEQVDNMNIFITDLNGRTIWNTQRSAVEGLNVYEFSGLNIPSGMYMINVQKGGKIISSKLLKQ